MKSFAILASASAPAFFSVEKTLKHSTNLIDGGIVANNPSLVALIDAFSFEEKPSTEDIVLLSVGTGKACEIPYEIEPLQDASADWLIQMNQKSLNEHFSFITVCKAIFGFLLSKVGINLQSGKSTLTNPLIEILMNSQSTLAEFQTNFLMNEFNDKMQYKRINPNLGVKVQLDDASKIDILKNIGDLNEEDTNWILKNIK